MKILALVSSVALFAGGLLTQSTLNPALAKHADNLAAAQSLRVKFTYREMPGAPSDCSLEYSKPNMFRVETPDRLTVSDGTKTWDLNKTAKTYTETDANIKRTQDREVDAWAPFFQKEPYKDVTSAVAGSKRTVTGAVVQELTIGYPDGSSETLFLDQSAGVARGAMLSRKDLRSLTTASEIKLSDKPIDASEFKFTPPDDSKKVDNTPPAATYAEVAEIFKQSCNGCHNSGNPAAGLDTTSYDGIMAGGRSGRAVIPGDPDGSLLLQVVKHTKRPFMPKGSDQLDDSSIKKIEGWIKAGANK